MEAEEEHIQAVYVAAGRDSVAQIADSRIDSGRNIVESPEAM